MRYLSVDQSLASCAWTLWEDGKVLDKGIVKSGSKWSKTKPKPDVEYFHIITDQIDYIMKTIIFKFCTLNCDYLILESPAQSGFGNAVAALKTLFRAFEENMKVQGKHDRFFTIAPTSLKAYAREFLPEDEQFDGLTKAGKPKKVKMEKKHMVRACKLMEGDAYLAGITQSAGAGDLADSYLLGHMFYEKLI